MFGETVKSRCIPVMSGLFIIEHKKGSRVKMNIKGDRGQLCRVPSMIPNEGERYQFTFTRVEGQE